MSTKCSACGHDNRQGRKFCADCGGPLSIACPGCGAVNEPGEKFCGDCGASLTATEKSAPSSPAAVPVAGEKKHITVLFADVAGSMDLQEQLDAEVWAQIMGRFISILAEGVRKFGGTVDKFTGDGIMALFGAPVAQEDHARRACHAAWHLTRAIGEYSEELRREQGIELHVRLGVNSGEVVVGRVGDDVMLDPTALGHTVGLAQRMEALAEPGAAYLSEHTARLVDGWFGLEGLGVRSVKGARAPLTVYRLGPQLSSPIRRTVGVSPLVGRERELSVLEDALAMANEGQFQVVGVVGEAGVGKSRLCEEFTRLLAARHITVRRTSGVSHGRDVPLLPILAFQREYFGITDTDGPETARRKVTDRLVELDPSLDDVAPLLLDFLEVPDPDRPVPPMAPEVRMRRVFDAIRRVTTRRSERETFVLIFEDLHWFDAQSEAFLERLIESYPGSRTLVVANFRPEFSARWTRHSYYRQLPLAPLREGAVTELVGGMLGMDLSLAPLVTFILERTGGNPFFVEEVIRALIEDGVLAGQPGRYRLTRPLEEIRVPPSVQAVLAARIDRLLPEYKAVLETASVIGRTFDTAVLSRVAGMTPHDLEEALSVLCAGELLQDAGHGEVASARYRFWHPLTQEVAYASLLSDRRISLHRAVAEAFIALDAARHDERAALIAAHFEEAGDVPEAARWHFRAGGTAMRRDFNEAVRRWRRTVILTDRVPAAEETRAVGAWARARLLQIGSRLGMSSEEADRLVAEGRALSEGLDDLRPFIAVNRFYTTVQLNHGVIEDALVNLLELAELGDASGDSDLAAALWLGPAVAYTFGAGTVADGRRAADRVMALSSGHSAGESEHLGYHVTTPASILLARLMAESGHLSEAVLALDRAVALGRERAESEWVAFGLAAYPRIAEFAGTSARALPSALEALRLGDDLGSTMVRVAALHGLGLAHLLEGRETDAAGVLDSALSEARHHNAGRFEEPDILTHRAAAYLATGDVRSARTTVEESIAVSRRGGIRSGECQALLLRADVWRMAGEHEQALADIDLASQIARERGIASYEPVIREKQARIRNDEAGLREALRMYRQIGATGHAKRLHAELPARTAQ